MGLVEVHAPARGEVMRDVIGAGRIAVHGEDGLRHPPTQAIFGRGGGRDLGGRRMEVGENRSLGSRQSQTIDETGVVEGIAVDAIVGLQDRG